MVDLWTTNFGQPSPDLSPQDHLELRSGFRLSYAVAGPKLPHYLKKFLLLAIWSVHGLLRPRWALPKNPVDLKRQNDTLGRMGLYDCRHGH